MVLKLSTSIWAVPQSKSKISGLCLLQFPDLVEKILKEVVNAVDVPVTLKIRTGWDKMKTETVCKSAKLQNNLVFKL